MKNAWDGVAMALEFIQTGNYFYVIPFIPVFETIQVFPSEKKPCSWGIKKECWTQKTLLFAVIIRYGRWNFYLGWMHL